MNTELLREDEREWADQLPPPSVWKNMLQRLIEEREKNARLEVLRALDQTAAELVEAELAEARKDSERLDWLFKVGDAAQHSRAAIDAAMKEGK